MDQMHISHLLLTENLHQHLRATQSWSKSMAPAEQEVWAEQVRLRAAVAGVARQRSMAQL
jgi:hypothetical protein